MVGTLVIVVVMGALSLTLWHRPQVPFSPAATASAPAVGLVATPASPSPDPYAALIHKGVSDARQGELQAAVAAFRRASDIDPGNPLAWTNLGVVLIRLGDEARGLEAFRRALRSAPGYSEAHRNFAVALDRQGRRAEAARHYRAFLELSGIDDPARTSVTARLREIGAGRTPE
jgi:Flp pilus assembly protein TadD